MKKPYWLNKKIDLSLGLELRKLLRGFNLRTVCEEAGCPNLGECFSKGIATFLIFGDTCTRNCQFCGVNKGRPGKLDPAEPKVVALAIKKLGLKYVVLTSVSRDDLEDRGVGQFSKVVELTRELNPGITIETLIPDFSGKFSLLKKFVLSNPKVIAHNIETVPRLYAYLRQGSNYRRSLEVLRNVKKIQSGIYTKSAILLGLGEQEQEVLDLFTGLRSVDCDFLSIGQYLSPSSKHAPVVEFIEPDRFGYYKRKALELGFKYVASSPYTRSSYKASDYFRS